MFRKRSVDTKKQKAVRRRAIDAEDGDEDEVAATNERDGVTISQQIQNTKKKRQLLTAIQYKRGVDANQLLQKDTARPEQTETEESKVKTAVETSKNGVLEQKHQQAMEDYINAKLGTNQKQMKADSSNLKEDSKDISHLSEEALYQELAAAAMRLSGKDPQAEELLSAGDTGAGGAVLGGGTGIAEVILPEEQRLKVAQLTEKARAEMASRGKPASGHRTPSAMPSRFSVPANLQPSAFNMEYHCGSDKKRKTAPSTAEETADVTMDSDRPGFEALKRQKHGKESRRADQKNQASDQRVFTKFVTRQRELNR